ncbi:hypothetical protein, conserved [Eimeria praecox]|uniref:Uncharacterized protein n=1 Tax=Eimeria praecox TaxID=51316 RepID=U6G0T2_9EIME|nr:hypothetical protein, conserved [Eimeria praecox]
MVSPLIWAGHGRLPAVRVCKGPRPFYASPQQQTQRAPAHPGAWTPPQQQQYQQQHMLMRNPSLRMTCRRSISWGTRGSIRCSATAAAANRSTTSASPGMHAAEACATASQPYKFKSAAHRDMVVLSTRLHLQDLLLQRFGRLKTAECCLLRKASGTPRLLLLWADLLVQQNPGNPPANAFFVPPELYRLPEVKALLHRDRELRWLMQRIDPKGVGGPCDSSRDCVPVPHFPSVLQQEVPRFPYEPHQLEMLRDTYGLLKWPFKPLRGAARAAAEAAAAAVAAGNAEVPQISLAEPTREGVAAAVAAVAAAVDRGDVQRANSKIRTRCCTDAIYAPDETETGAYVWW